MRARRRLLRVREAATVLNGLLALRPGRVDDADHANEGHLRLDLSGKNGGRALRKPSESGPTTVLLATSLGEDPGPGDRRQQLADARFCARPDSGSACTNAEACQRTQTHKCPHKPPITRERLQLHTAASEAQHICTHDHAVLKCDDILSICVLGSPLCGAVLCGWLHGCAEKYDRGSAWNARTTACVSPMGRP